MIQETTIAQKPNWFEEWFDSDYYHILYRERDEEEAKLLLNNLLQKLLANPQHSILDLACGRGRHANYLAALGYTVTGLDLSPMSINYARQQAPPNAQFHIHDMRQPFGMAKYDVVLNLFTSFGYFENEAENIQVMRHISNSLKTNGIVVIEYMNPLYVSKHLVASEIKTLNGINFNITKEIKAGFVYKHIHFTHHGVAHSFTERVMLVTKEQFEGYFNLTGLGLVHVFGDFELHDYVATTSPRMILVATKKDTNHE